MLNNLYNRKCTIYCVIPSKSNTPAVYGHRFVLNDCAIENTTSQRLSGVTIQLVNVDSVITKNIADYRPPTDTVGSDSTGFSDYGFYAIPQMYRNKFYTVNAQDFIVYDVVDDEISTAQEFSALKNKYKNNGMIVAQGIDNRKGLKVDNITAVSQ